MTTDRKPTYYLPMTIESQRGDSPNKKGIIFRNIPCQIFVPDEPHEEVRAYLELSDHQAEVIGTFGHLFWRMSLQGWLRWGGTYTQIRANRCYIPNSHWPMRPHGCSFVRISLPLEVLDLGVVEVHQIDNDGITENELGKNDKAKKPRTLPLPEEPPVVTFWLTQNRDLTTLRIESSHFNGSIEVKEAGDALKVALSPQVELTFNRQYRWDTDVKAGRHNRRQGLMATLSLPAKGKKPVVVEDTLVEDVDDFLLLCSVATRWNTICLGYNISQWPYTTKKYRRRRTLPKHLQNPRRPIEQDYETGLISPSNLSDFFQHAWPQWKSLPSPSQAMLREVFGAVVHAQSLDLQTGFIALYAALEMMVLNFRRQNDLEFVLPADSKEWNKLQKDLKKFISSHTSLSGDEPERVARRRMTHEKVRDFNRVAFGTAFNAFCAHTVQPIPHQDLWPVNGNNSLSHLRNRLVHGELRGRDDTNALWHAKMHIEWLVERCVLCLLSWPIEKSRVSSSYLSDFNPYKAEKWQASRTALFS